MTERVMNIAEDGSFSWTRYGKLMIVYAEPGDVPAHRFDAWIADIEAYKFPFVIGAAGGGASITGKQRRRVIEAFGNERNVVVLVDDRLTRGIFTALSWLGLNVRCYPWLQMHEAIEYLELPELTTAEVAEMVVELRAAAEAAAGKESRVSAPG